MPGQRPKVVIVGAGFGGLEARRCRRDRSPELSLLPAAALSGGDRGAVAGRCGLANPAHANPAQKVLHTNYGDVAYDYLVIATGAKHSYFGHDEWADYAPGLKRIEDATRIRRTILIAFEPAELTTDAAERRRLLTFVIVGGGATGVEMAGAIAEIARQTLAVDFRRIDPRTARITLMGPRLLPAFPTEQSDYVRTPVPGMAPAAKQMGKYVAKVIAARIAGRPSDAPFRYVHVGELATIGRRAAVVEFGRLHLRGFHRLAVLERGAHLFPDRIA